MIKYDVTLSFKGAKINGIKTIRSALGIGLKEAKDASERYGMDATYTQLTLNARQTADLMHYAQEEAYRMRDGYGAGERELTITNVNRYEDDGMAFDFSALA